jgi:6-phosphogluconolactonase
VYALLGDLPFKQQIPWAKSHLFWGDERLVPPEHPGSNYGQVARLLLARLPLPPGNVHRAKGELTEEACVADYKAQLKRFAGEGRDWPRFDLVLLGMGSDGHTASLFPGPIAANEWREPVVSVNADYDGRPSKRITLTPLVLNGGRRIVFLVTGTKKAKALAAVLQGPYQPETWPAQRIRCEQCSITWLVDEAAAALLPADNPGFDELP